MNGAVVLALFSAALSACSEPLEFAADPPAAATVRAGSAGAAINHPNIVALVEPFAQWKRQCSLLRSFDPPDGRHEPWTL